MAHQVSDCEKIAIFGGMIYRMYNNSTDYIAAGAGVIAALSLVLLIFFPTLPAMPVVYFVGLVPLVTGILIGYMNTNHKVSPSSRFVRFAIHGLRAAAILALPIGVVSAYLLFFVVGYGGGGTVMDSLRPLAVVLAVTLSTTTVGTIVGQFLASR